jgi:replicative DNA helicase
MTKTLSETTRLEKVPPQNVDAEVAVLGSMLIEVDAIAQGVQFLTPEAFYKDAHRKIFQCIINLFTDNKAIDLVTLTEYLNQEGQLEEVGGPSYLAFLTTAVPTAANILYYARIVKEKYVLRHLIQNATQIVTDCYDPSQEVESLLDRAEKAIFEITSKKFSGGIVPLKDIIRNQIEVIDKLYQRKEHITGLATGFHEFDTQTAGLQPSDLIIIAARPSMGKSALMTCIAEHVGMAVKAPVAIFSLEMSKEQLIQRMLCSCARVNAHKVRTGFLAQSDWPNLTKAAAKLSEAPIYIDDTPGISILELKAKARRMKAQYDIKLIILDYLQLMQGSGSAESRQQEISEISRSLKALARELSVPLIAISQLSRAVESRTDHRPQLSDLRESGAIEQDADVVVLLLREEYYNPTEENKGKAEVIIAKQRNGPVGSVFMTFIHEYTRFENMELTRREEMAGSAA